MTHLVRITARPPRCWILGRRVHHGLTGVIGGLALMAHDIRDLAVWFRDLHHSEP